MPITSRLKASSGVTADASNRVSAWADSLGLVNNFTQATDANKPLLSRADNKENLALSSEDFGNATYWVANNCTITSNQAQDSDGNTVLANMVAAATNTQHSTYPQAVGNRVFVAGLSYTMTMQVRYNNHRYVQLAFSSGPFTVNDFVNFDLVGKTIGTVGSGITAYSITETSTGSGIFNISITANCSATATSSPLFFIMVSSGSSGRGATFSATGTESVYIGRGQLRRTATDSTYLATTTFPQYAGVNGRQSLVFNGAQALTTTSQLSAFYTNSASCIYIVVKPYILGSEHQMTRASAAGHFAVRTKSADGFYFINDDGTARYSTSPTAVANNVYVIRGRHISGNIYCAIDLGNGYSEGSPVACGNATTMTATYMIGANAGTALYGQILEVVTYNEGTPNINIELELREQYLTSGRLTFNPFTGTFSKALSAPAKIRELLLNVGLPYLKQ